MIRGLLVAMALLLPLSVAAQDAAPYPNRPVRLLVGFPPGGGVDLLARVLAQRLQDRLGQPFVVENRPGQAGTLSTEYGAKSPPDGYTLLMVNIGIMTLNPHLYRNYPIDPRRDVAPISRLVTNSFFFFVPADLPVRTLAEFVAMAKARPGQMNFGSAGAGGITHVAPEVFRRVVGIDIVHVPYRGSAPAMNDLMAGRTQLQMDIWGVGEGAVQSGRVRALAVSGPVRSTLAPDVPTAAEAVQPPFVLTGWQGMAAPAGTPRPIIDRLNAELRLALADPEIARRLLAQGNDPAPSTPEEFRDLIAEYYDRMGRVIREGGITAD
jgi:tripartite-type tricarboxylate transporter receptor subunit TctC